MIRINLMILGLFVTVFIKSTVSVELDDDGFYPDTNPETKKTIICREVLVKQGFEAVPCKINGTRDGVRKCPGGQYQPDETYSRNSPQCLAEEKCILEGIKEASKCIGDYCWKGCICNLEAGKCGLDHVICADTKNIKCAGTIQQDCSCARTENTTTVPTSTPTRIKPDNSSSIPRNNASSDTTQKTDTNGTTNWTLPVIISSTVVFLLIIIGVIFICIKHFKRTRKGTGDLNQQPQKNYDPWKKTTCCILINESDEDPNETQGDPNETQDDPNETQGDQNETQGDQNEIQGNQNETPDDQNETQGDQNETPGDQNETQGDQNEIQGNQNETPGDQNETQGDQNETQGDPDETPDETHCKYTSIPSNGANIHYIHKSNLSLHQLTLKKHQGHRENAMVVVDTRKSKVKGYDANHRTDGGQSSCSVKVYPDSKLKEEHDSDEGSCPESDPLLNPSDDPDIRHLNQQFQRNDDPDETEVDPNETKGDVDETHCKLFIGTNGNDENLETSSSCQMTKKNDLEQRKKSMKDVDVKKCSVKYKSFPDKKFKKVAVVKPNVKNSPLDHNAGDHLLQGQELQDEATPYLSNWDSFGNSINDDSIDN